MDLMTEKNWWQRNWKWVVPGGIIFLCVICPVLSFITLFGVLRSSEVYQTALKEAKSNPDVVHVLGEPVEPGWWVSGSIKVSGPTGRADIVIPISGPENSGMLYVVAMKTAGQWRFMTLEVAVNEQDERINLLKAPVIALPPTPTPLPLLSTSTSTPAPSPTSISLSGRIVFSSSPYDGRPGPFGSDKNFEIYVMNANGSNQTRLTYNQVRSGGPDWSPDGSRIAFSSGRDQNFEIYVMNADGSNQTRLTYNQGINQSPDWSPDGSRIAFESNHDIYVMDADGSNQTRLTDSQAFDKDSDWAPDGSRIVFSSNRDGDNFEIYVIEADGSNLITRITHNTANDHDPAWSPDGSRIAFYSYLDTSFAEIYVMDADGSNLTRLTNNHASDSNPKWSPDGKYITFTSDRDGTFDIYVMNADGSEQTSLTHNPERTDYQSSWSP